MISSLECTEIDHYPVFGTNACLWFHKILLMVVICVMNIICEPHMHVYATQTVGLETPAVPICSFTRIFPRGFVHFKHKCS